MDELPERFWSKTSIEDRGFDTACVVWTACTKSDGYGQFALDGAMRLAHRVAFEALVGPIPKGLQLDHLCRVRACVAADHLEPVTSRENTLRGRGISAVCAAKTHCPQGHAYDEENTRIRPQGGRDCRACHCERERVRYHAQRAQQLDAA